MFGLCLPRSVRTVCGLLSATLSVLLLAPPAALAAAPQSRSGAHVTSHAESPVRPRSTSVHLSGLHEAGSSGVTLDEVISLSVRRAPMLDARRAQIEAARQESRRAGALPDPELFVGIDNLPATGPDAFDFNADEMTMKRIGVRQALPSRAKREVARRLAERRVDEAYAQSSAEQLDVRRAVADAWIDLWAAQRELSALGMLRDEAVLASKLATARVSGSSEPVADALAAAMAVVELDNRIEAARGTQAAAQAKLARWTGVRADVTASHAPDFTRLPVPEARLLAAIDRLGPLLSTNAELETAAAAVDAARAERRPDWTVGASYGQRGGGRSDMISLEVGVGLPLFGRNRQDRGIAAREADYQAALHTREDLRRRQQAEIRADIAVWEGLKRQVAREESEWLPLARDRSNAALSAFAAGAEVRPWLDARRDELVVVVAHAQRQGELARAWASLAYLLPTEPQR